MKIPDTLVFASARLSTHAKPPTPHPYATPSQHQLSPAPTMPPAPEVDKRQAAREVIDILHEIATLLNTHLNRQQLSYCVSLIENGVNPEALANVIKELRTQYPPPLEEEEEEEAR